MSANDQIPSNVDGGMTTANGSVDDGEVSEAMPANALPTDDAADASSQSGGSDAEDEDEDAVDDGTAGSAPAPITDPSVPPANGSQPLIDLPVELLRLVTADLDPIAHHSVRLSCPFLREQLDAPPLMSHGEYIQFHKQLEAHSPCKLRDLLCAVCTTFKGSIPSKNTFTDAQAVQNYSGRRTCIECGTANGHYDKRDVVIKKKKLFLCGGCKLMLAHEKEEKVVQDVVITKGYPYHDSGWGRGAEITFTAGGKRWCKLCRVVIAGLGDSGAMRMKQVYMP